MDNTFWGLWVGGGGGIIHTDKIWLLRKSTHTLFSGTGNTSSAQLQLWATYSSSTNKLLHTAVCAEHKVCHRGHDKFPLLTLHLNSTSSKEKFFVDDSLPDCSYLRYHFCSRTFKSWAVEEKVSNRLDFSALALFVHIHIHSGLKCVQITATKTQTRKNCLLLSHSDKKCRRS